MGRWDFADLFKPGPSPTRIDYRKIQTAAVAPPSLSVGQRASSQFYAFVAASVPAFSALGRRELRKCFPRGRLLPETSRRLSPEPQLSVGLGLLAFVCTGTNGRGAGVENHLLRPFTVAVNPDHRQLSRCIYSSLPRSRDCRECLADDEKKREQRPADKLKISRYGHFRLLHPRNSAVPPNNLRSSNWFLPGG